MPGSRFGELFSVTTFGESHGPALGCVIDGCPAGLSLSLEDISRELRRRRPGQGGASTSRGETDEPEILSGVFEGKTLGTPIAILVRNADHHSADYENLRDLYRPGHADLSWETKYGFRDHRGGGRTSGRETLCRVAAGAVAKVLLAANGMQIRAWTSSIAGIDIPGPISPNGGRDPAFDYGETENNPFRIPRRDYVERVAEKIEALKKEGDSAGGVVSCRAEGLPAGLGEPVFGKLDARLAAALLSLGACKGIEFGAGFEAARMKGSENNDVPLPDKTYKTNNAGGVLGGISTGLPLEFRAAFKPVPSISKPQETADRQGRLRQLVIHGRHDVCIVPRAVPVVEAMTALVLADLLLLQRSARI
ncbi:MAG: chorismate synthase [Treponema sp.]|jgi:chorismate synthase|nr:chorismate synthase [Treponema sp.]